MDKIFLILLIVFPLTAISQNNTDARKLLDQGEALVTDNPQEAFVILEKAMNQSKSSEPETYLRSVYVLTTIRNGTDEQNEKIFSWAYEALQAPARYPLLTAQLHFGISRLFNREAFRTDSSLVHLRKAVGLLEDKPTKEMSEYAAACYADMGDIYKYQTFDFNEAERCYEQALQILEQVNSSDQDQLTRIYYNLAATNRSQRDYEKALAYAIKTLSVVTNNPDLREGFLEISYTMAGNIYRDRGEFDFAIRNYQKAIDLNRKSESNRSNLAAHFANLGEAYRLQGKKDALTYFEKAATILEKEEGRNNQLYIFCMQTMIKAYLRAGDEKHAKAIFRNVSEHLNQLNLSQSRQAAEMYLSFGNHSLQKNKPDSAILWYQRSVQAVVTSFHPSGPIDNPTLDQLQTSYHLFDVFYLKARALESLYLQKKDPDILEHAIECLVLSEKLMSAGRNALDVEESRWKFMDIDIDLKDPTVGFDLYEKAIDLLFELSQKKPNDSIQQRAFYFFERSKAQALSYAISDAKRSHQIGISDSLLSQRENLKMTLFALQNKLEREKDPAALDHLREEMVSVDRKIQHLKNYIEETFPAYFQVEFEFEVPKVELLQRWSGNNDVTVIEYFMGRRNVYALLVNDRDVVFKKLSTADSLSTGLQALLVHLSGSQSSLDPQVFSSFHAHSFEVFKEIIQPFNAYLEEQSRLMVIPDRLISQIPLEILIDKPGIGNGVNYKSLSYLLNKHSISYAYSATSLLSRPPVSNEKIALLAMGFTNGDSLRAVDKEMKEIPGTEKELVALNKYFSQGKFLTGNDATESNFKKLVSDYDIVHLAIHGKGDPERNYSASLFFRSLTDSIDDGELHAYELYGLKLKARLTVLSACESGLGKSYSGEGMISMASAFTYAGCQDILMSLWKVQDQIAVELMDDFYKELLEGRSIDEALAISKRNYLAASDDLTGDPRIWAPMISYGNQEKLFRKQRSKPLYYIVLPTVGLLLFGIWYFARKTTTS